MIWTILYKTIFVILLYLNTSNEFVTDRKKINDTTWKDENCAPVLFSKTSHT